MREYEDIMTVAAVNFRQVWGNKESNLSRIKGYIVAAAKKGADLIVFPEMALNGYDNETEIPWADKMQVKTAETILGESVLAIAEVTKKYKVYAVFGMSEKDAETGKVYNSAVACGPEGIIGSYRKIHPALEEQCWCVRGDEPFAFDTPWGPVGIGICYDTYNFNELARYYAAYGCRLYLNPTAIGPGGAVGFDWRDYYMSGINHIVTSCEIFVASSNLTSYSKVNEEEGGSRVNLLDKGGAFGGGSMVVGPGLGEMIHIYDGDVNNLEEGISIATIDLSLAARKNFKVDPVKNCPDYRPDIYIKMNEKLLELPFWKQFRDK